MAMYRQLPQRLGNPDQCPQAVAAEEIHTGKVED
jgi:hypothetical protein